MITAADARALALALPEAVEQPHHDRVSFRVHGKIFATVPDDTHWNVMVGEDEIRAAAAADPRACELLWWGKKLSAVRVHLATVDAAHFAELLTDAWRGKAPAALRERLPADGPVGG